MKINSENCEAWFLDYYEGNLSKEGVEEMFAFLTLNPELRELFDSYDEVSFSPDKQIHFDGKADLKKVVSLEEGINESNYEEHFVSYVEGLLNADEKIAVDKFLLQFPSRQEEFEMLQKAILIPDASIVFEHKESLRKSILITQENFDEIAVSSMEGLLNKEEEKALSASLSVSAEQQKSFSLYKQTKLSPDTSIVFEDKESLKKRDRGAFWWIIDTRFAAAAAIALLIGVFYWNYSGTDQIVNDNGGLALVDTPKTNDDVKINGRDNLLANTSDSNNATLVKIDTGVRKKQIASVINVPMPISDDRMSVEAIVVADKKTSLNTNVNPKVDFSDSYYSYTTYKTTEPVVASNSISPRQAAMRWMKKKLDRVPVNNTEENPTYMTYGEPSGSNGDVSGFDLTSSAVAALGNATGSNLRLGHESEGTILTLGKYELLLSRNH